MACSSRVLEMTPLLGLRVTSVSRRVASRRVMSRRVMSCHVMSSRVAPYPVMSYHVMLCHRVSRRVASRRVLCHVPPCRVALCLVASCRVMLVKRAAATLPANAPLRFTQPTLTPRILTPLASRLFFSALSHGMCQSYRRLLHSVSHPRLSVKLQMWGYPVLLLMEDILHQYK